MTDDGRSIEEVRARLLERLAARSRPSPARAIREARIRTAMSKVSRVIYREVVCHQKELERRVCEVGFRFYPLAEQKDRPEPVHLNEARQRLSAQDRLAMVKHGISGNQHHFYYDPDRDPALVNEVLMGRIEAVTAFEAVQRNPHLSGWALEALLHEAMAQSGQVEAEPYRQGEDITEFNGRRATHGIDLAGVHRTAGLPFVIEVKNVREWVYPQSPIVWRLLGTAAELGAVPVLICRRVPEPTYLFMDEIGGYAYPTMNLMIDEAVNDAPEGEAFRAAIQTLGYRDTHFVNPKEPPKAPSGNNSLSQW